MKIPALIIVVLSIAIAPSTQTTHHEVTVKRGPTPPWLEVYHDGVLTSEWQPADGQVYRALELLLDDSYYATDRANKRNDPQRALLAAQFPFPL